MVTVEDIVYRMNRIEERLDFWSQKKVDDLKNLILSLYKSINSITTFLGMDNEITTQSDTIEVKAPLIPEGTILLIDKFTFEDQKLPYIDETYYSQIQLTGAMLSGDALLEQDFSRVAVRVGEEHLPKMTYNRFSTPLPADETVRITSKEIIESSTDPKVVICIPSKIASKYPYTPFATVLDTTSVGIEFEMEERNPRDLNFVSKFPITKMYKIGTAKRRFQGTQEHQITIPNNFWGTGETFWTVDPFATKIVGLVISQTILWFDLT